MIIERKNKNAASDIFDIKYFQMVYSLYNG